MVSRKVKLSNNRQTARRTPVSGVESLGEESQKPKIGGKRNSKRRQSAQGERDVDATHQIELEAAATDMLRETLNGAATAHDRNRSAIPTIPFSRPKRASLVTRPPAERIARIHELLANQSFPNCQTLAKACEVGAKTIQRDIEFMRSRRRLPIAYDPVRHGYYYTEPVSHFPDVEITGQEVLALRVAQKSLAQNPGSGFDEPLQTISTKLRNRLPETLAKVDLELDGVLTFKQTGVCRPDPTVSEAIQMAVHESRELALDYLKLKSTVVERRRVQPYALACVNGGWYCFGYDMDRREERTFHFSRIHGVKVLDTRFERPAGFSVEQFLAGSFGVFTRSNARMVSESVCIRFDAWAARLVQEKIWHPTQTLRSLPNGGVELHMKLNCLEEVERWVLSWGGHATVLEPPALRARLREAATAILESTVP